MAARFIGSLLLPSASLDRRRLAEGSRSTLACAGDRPRSSSLDSVVEVRSSAYPLLVPLAADQY